MRVLAIDLGERRTGVAMSDPTGSLATPLDVLQEASRSRLLEEVGRMARERGVEVLVVGHPRHMDGSRGTQARRAEAFADLLRDRLGLPVVLWDERLTTVQAERLAGGGASRRPLDSAAAALILQEYLDSRKS